MVQGGDCEKCEIAPFSGIIIIVIIIVIIINIIMKQTLQHFFCKQHSVCNCISFYLCDAWTISNSEKKHCVFSSVVAEVQ